MTAYLQHLRVFLEAFREGSVSRAAVRLGISQPAASAQIRALEAHLGKPLFERGARGVRPTAHGQDLAQKLASHLDALDFILAAMKTRSAALSGTIHIVGPRNS
jgi:DNA-binding transcriptional LysR family regulator